MTSRTKVVLELPTGSLSGKQQIMSQVQTFPSASDVQVFFEELPEGSYDQHELVNQLNQIITRRGRAQAIGGILDLHTVQHIPPNWEQAYHERYQEGR